ncbi:MAG: FAD-dependent oxidoreductase, partial [Firmicutes bacterium]|nr:FAD-dependent oxidoreductase [Bacillota bacterium]
LCEKDAELGGQIHAACVPIGKQDLTKVVQFMSHRIEDVDVRLNRTVTKEMIETEFKDYEIIASVGAKPNTIPAFHSFKQTLTADDILLGKGFPGRKIVIIGGGSVGCELADYLAPLVNDRFIRNRDITILEMAPEIMMSETGPGRSILVLRMQDKGIHIECGAKVTKVDASTITYEQKGEEYIIDDADTLVFANGYHVDPSFEEMLKETGNTYHLIGDGHKVGNIRDAISEAWLITKEI